MRARQIDPSFGHSPSSGGRDTEPRIIFGCCGRQYNGCCGRFIGQCSARRVSCPRQRMGGWLLQGLLHAIAPLRAVSWPPSASTPTGTRSGPRRRPRTSSFRATRSAYSSRIRNGRRSSARRPVSSAPRPGVRMAKRPSVKDRLWRTLAGSFLDSTLRRARGRRPGRLALLSATGPTACISGSTARTSRPTLGRRRREWCGPNRSLGVG